MVAGRYLRSKRREGFISVIAGFSFLGIMLGVATLIIVMAVMNGFREELIGRIIGLNGHINVYERGAPLYPYQNVADVVAKMPGVVSAAPSIEGQALMNVQGNAAGVMVRAMTEQDFAKKPILSTSVQDHLPGNYFSGDQVAIGTNLAQRFNLQVGDKIVLIAPKGKTTPFGTIPRSRSFTVGAIFDVGMFEYNNGFVFMPLEIAQAFFDLGEGVSAIEVRVSNPQKLEAIKSSLKSELGPAYGVADWQDNNASFYTALKVEQNVMFLILTLIIVVAAFNIISSLIMLVKDKGRDIAILRTMGATRGMIVRIFLYTGTTIGIGGTIAGTLLGIGFASNIEKIRRWLESMTGENLFSDEIYFLSKLPAKMEPHEVIIIVGMSLVLCFAATIYPAWRAARLDPVEALRRE